MHRTRWAPLAGMAGALLLTACSGSASPDVDTNAAGSTGRAATAATASGGSTVAPSVDDTTQGDTTPPGSDTTVEGAPADASTTISVSGQGNASTTTALPGSPATVTVPIAGGGGGGGPSPTSLPPTAPNRADPTNPTTTAAARPTLDAGGPNGDTQVHCMGSATSAQASATWSTSAATQVAVALGRVADAFSSPYNPNPLPKSGSYPVPIDCKGPNQQVITVTAMGPGGKTTKYVTWTIHHM